MQLLQQQYQQPLPPMMPRPKNETMKTLAIVFFAGGFVLHIASFIPFIGLIFGILAFFSYIAAFVFLCLI